MDHHENLSGSPGPLPAQLAIGAFSAALTANDVEVPRRPAPRSLGDLIARLEADEQLVNDDAVVPMSALAMNHEGEVCVPDRGTFELTSWSRQQIASRLGIRWNTWFSGIDPSLRAQEINRRLALQSDTVRVRTDRAGLLRGIVSPTYTPVADSLVARALLRALPGGETLKVTRFSTTDRTVSWVVQVVEMRRNGPGRIGDLTGGVLVRNSSVGYASLVAAAHITRLICTNGMVVSQERALLRRRHQHLRIGTIEVIEAALANGVRDLPERLNMAANTLEASAHHAVTNVRQTLRDVLTEATLPTRKLMPIMLDAYAREPHSSIFGIAQAITRGAQSPTVSPEDRLALERAAGLLVAGSSVEA